MAEANRASRWRLAVARQIAAVYAARPGVRMIVAGGSAARGTADAWSDLDVVVYWDAVDSAWLENAPLTLVGGERFTYVQGDERGSRLEQYFMRRADDVAGDGGSLKVDVASLALASWEQMVADVLERHDIAAGKQKALGGFLESVVLHGDDEYHRWAERIAAYPDALAEKMVQAHLTVLPAWVAERMALDRGELFGFYDLVCDAIRNVIGMLAGLNRRYHSTGPEPKWTEHFLSGLPLQPPNTYDRIVSVLDRRDHVSIERFYELVAEVYDLVDRHLPAVDTSRARAVLGFPIAPCKPPAVWSDE